MSSVAVLGVAYLTVSELLAVPCAVGVDRRGPPAA
jgi:hypothetical protein